MPTVLPQLEKSIKTYLSPLLRSDGFSGSGREFRKTQGILVQVLQIQGSREGGKFTVNISIQPISIPDVLGKPVDPKKISFASCEFRARMTESGLDQWWAHDGSQASMDAAVQDVARVYIAVGRQMLIAISSPESPIFTLSPDQLTDGRSKFFGFGSTVVRMALALSRLRKAQGDLVSSRAFAEFGLANLGGASALKHEFQALCSNA
ncbi:MAG: DUF4304 domain-containing protein [Holophagaceae bacterium]|nr:DUF4304 domain-containing protein [Holophagaceae bacterium]